MCKQYFLGSCFPLMTFTPSKALPNYDKEFPFFPPLFSSFPLECHLQNCMGVASLLSTGPTDKPGSRFSPRMATPAATPVAPCHFCVSVPPKPVTHHTLCWAPHTASPGTDVSSVCSWPLQGPQLSFASLNTQHLTQNITQSRC